MDDKSIRLFVFINSHMSTYQSRPDNINHLLSKFKMTIHRLKGVEYFCQAAQIPGIRGGVVTQATRYNKIPHPGDELEFDELTLKFQVDEDLQNYLGVLNWIRGINFPVSSEEYANVMNEPITLVEHIQGGTYKNLNPEFGGTVSDLTLTVLSSKSQAHIHTFFRDAFPISISPLDFVTTESGDVEPRDCTISFRYSRFDIQRVVDNPPQP